MITIRKGLESLAFKSWDFPDGGLGVRLDTDNLRYFYANREDQNWGNCGKPTGHQTIVARIQSSRDVMELVMITDALRRWDSTPIELFLPCCPYSRQDRVCVKGESFSLKAFAAIINSLGFQKVTILDPHSEVTPAVIDRIEVVDQVTLIGRFDKFNARLQPPMPYDRAKLIFVSPDAGANKKTAELAKHYGHTEFIRADKLRDLSNGNIKETIVYANDLTGRHVVICDDLIDGGRTFIELAKVLKFKGADKVILYATHGIFSKGVEVLFSGGIDEVYCTNSFKFSIPNRENLTVLEIEGVFHL